MANHLITSVNVQCGNGRCERSFTSQLTHEREVCPYCLYACEPLILRELRENAVSSGIVFAHKEFDADEYMKRPGVQQAAEEFHDREPDAEPVADGATCGHQARANTEWRCKLPKDHAGPHAFAVVLR